MKALALAITLAACAPAPVPAPPPPLFVEEPAQPPAPAPVPPPVASVARQYRAAVQREKSTALAPDATVDSVRAIHDADADARNALRTLEEQGHHATQAALKAARDAVRRLSDVLKDLSP